MMANREAAPPSCRKRRCGWVWLEKMTIHEDAEHCCMWYLDARDYPFALDRVMEVLTPMLKRSFPRLRLRALVHRDGGATWCSSG